MIDRDATQARGDAPFSVSFHHRLRFTDDLMGRDRDVLLDILEPSGDQVARVQIWVDEYVASARPDLIPALERFARSCPERFSPASEVQIVPGGEAVKNDPAHLERILKEINDADLDRRSYMIVVGGGAVLDAVGFAAAIAHRGIRLVRLPTTTLAQADSGVGVKTAINFFGKKNWLGAFAVPWAVINDTALLASLPDRDFLCGFSEAVKVSLLKSPVVFDQLCRDATRIRHRDMAAALPMIRASVEFHLAHITQGGDPFEAREARPLDFGHWSAHKLEPMSHFAIRHGEAVAIGVAIDSRLFQRSPTGLPKAQDADRVLRCLGEPRLHPQTTRCSQDTSISCFDGLEEFRQHLGGRLTDDHAPRRWAIPVDIHEVDDARMRQAIEHVARYGSRRRIRSTERPEPPGACGLPTACNGSS